MTMGIVGSAIGGLIGKVAVGFVYSFGATIGAYVALRLVMG